MEKAILEDYPISNVYVQGEDPTPLLGWNGQHLTFSFSPASVGKYIENAIVSQWVDDENVITLKISSLPIRSLNNAMNKSVTKTETK